MVLEPCLGLKLSDFYASARVYGDAGWSMLSLLADSGLGER